MVSYSVFLIDDEDSIRQGIGLALSGTYRFSAFATAEEGLGAMEKEPPDLVLLDVGLPGLNGIEALARIKARWPDVLVIMITAYEDFRTVIAAMKLGAHDYVVKPIHMEGLEVTISNSLETIRLRKEVQVLQERSLQENLPCFIGESNAIQDIMEFIGVVAKSPDTPVLIVGETGTGKELLASAIHYRSPHFKGPLVTVNCAAIPRELVESELFGYEKGAFSGANASGKKGLIEEAANGTLFLDEVGDLHLEAQAKLLRFLEEGEFYRVGGIRKLHVQTRVVSATNQELEALIAQNRFRRDLYFRLGVVKIEVPTLNERREDILPLSQHFLAVCNEKLGRNFQGFSREAEDALLAHSWSGNVRELKNLIERGVLVGNEPELTSRDLGLEGQSGPAAFPLGSAPLLTPLTSKGLDLSRLQQELEWYYLEEAFKLAGGNESKAARLLGLNHHTYRYRRKKARG